MLVTRHDDDGDNPNNSIAEIGHNTGKSFGDLR